NSTRRTGCRLSRGPDPRVASLGVDQPPNGPQGPGALREVERGTRLAALDEGKQGVEARLDPIATFRAVGDTSSSPAFTGSSWCASDPLPHSASSLAGRYSRR